MSPKPDEEAPTASGGPAWRRLHPLTPLVTLCRFAPALVLAVVPELGHRHSSGKTVFVYLGIGTAVLVAANVVSVVVTRWRFDGELLSITTGLLRRDERRLPVARIQSVDIVRPLFARAFGLAELRVRLAGAGGTRGRLAFVTERDALDLRSRLLAAHHGLDETTPEPPERRIAAVPLGRLVGSVAVTDLGLLNIAAVAAICVLGVVAPRILAVVLGGGASYLISFGRAPVSRVINEFGFTVAEAPDGLRVRSGLLQTTAETIPRGRVQAVREVEPFLWRPLGWRRLEVDVAGGVANRRGARGRRGAGRVTKTLLPVGSTAEAELLLSRVLGLAHPPLVRPPRRAAAKAPLGYRFLAGGLDDAHAVTVNGRLRKTTAWVPLEKVQSVRRVQGPVQRALGLASVHLDTAGRRVHAIFRDRDALESSNLVETLAAKCRAARERSGATGGRPQTTPQLGP